jgi:hypothetical protein
MVSGQQACYDEGAGDQPGDVPDPRGVSERHPDDRGDDGTAAASVGRPDSISAPASSVIVPPVSRTAGTATISTTAAAHSTLTAAPVGSAYRVRQYGDPARDWHE